MEEKQFKALIIAWLIVLSIFHFAIWFKIGMIDAGIDTLFIIENIQANTTMKIVEVLSIHTESIYDLQQVIK